MSEVTPIERLCTRCGIRLTTDLNIVWCPIQSCPHTQQRAPHMNTPEFKAWKEGMTRGGRED